MIERREIRGSRGKTLLYLAIALLFVGIGIWMVRQPTDSDSGGWITLVFLAYAPWSFSSSFFDLIACCSIATASRCQAA